MIQPKTIATNGRVKHEIGAPGLRQWSGYVDDEWDKRLRSRKQRDDSIQRMVDDSTIAAARTSIDALMRSSKMSIEPGIEEDKDAVQFVHSALDEMDESWSSTLTEINTFIDYGYSLFEIAYVMRDGQNGRSNDGKIGWRRWSTRAQDTIEKWQFSEDGREVTHAIQRDPNSYKEHEIPLDRCLHFKTRNRRQSPEGKSLIRAAYDAWYMKFNIQRLEAIGIERDMTGIPMMSIPADDYSDDGKKAGWMALVQNIRRDEHTGIVKPSIFDDNGNELYKFELISTAGQHQIDTDKVIARYERMILRVLLSDWMALGDAGGGSFALGVSKQEAFSAFVQGLLDIIADTITNQAIRPLCQINGISFERAPKMVFETISKRDLSRFAAAFTQLVQAGSVDPDDPAVREVVYKELGLPSPERGFDEALVDRVMERAPQPAQLQPGETEREPIGAKTFTERDTPELRARALAIWKDSVPDALAELLEAETV